TATAIRAGGQRLRYSSFLALSITSDGARQGKAQDGAEGFTGVLREGYRWSSGCQGRTAGPRYSARGRIRRLLPYCSRMWAVQPAVRPTAKTAAKRSGGMPSRSYT